MATVGGTEDSSSKKASSNVLGSPILAGVMVALGSLANFLRYNEYPLITVEGAIAAATLVLLAIIMGYFYDGQRRWGRIFLEFCLVYLLVDLHSSSIIIPAAIAITAVVVFSWMLSSTILPLLTTVGAVMLLSSVIGISDSRSWISGELEPPALAKPDKPAILHIILDEQIGIEGAAAHRGGMPGAERLLRETYLRRGFKLYGGAYSQHLQTTNSIPQILNLGTAVTSEVDKTGGKVGRSQYFTYLQTRGYKLHIWQSDFLNFCEGVQNESCVSYWSPSLQLNRSLDLTTADRSRLIVFKLAALSDEVDLLGDTYNLLLAYARLYKLGLKPLLISRWARSNSLVAHSVMNSFAKYLEGAQPGNAYFAHILFPHDPYIFNADCSKREMPLWDYRLSGTPEVEKEKLYVQQMACGLRQMERILDAFAASPAGKNSIVIIHGDHGSRITTRELLYRKGVTDTPSDMIAGFSTLFAMRTPSAVAAYDPTPVPVVSLLAEAVKADFHTAPDAKVMPKGKTVFLSDDEWHPVKTAPLPPDWPEQVRIGAGRSVSHRKSK